MTNREHYRLFAQVLHFPDDAFPANVRAMQEYLEAHHPDEAKEMQPFTEFALQASCDEREELFTRTFDVQAITTLDVGYVMFGDDYKRGVLLSNLNREHAALKTDCRNELADNLPNILKLIATLKDQELISELVDALVAPAMKKMIEEFDPERTTRRDKLLKKHYKTVLATSPTHATVYLNVLHVVYHILCKDFGVVEQSLPMQSSDFLKSIGTEMQIEDSQTK